MPRLELILLLCSTVYGFEQSSKSGPHVCIADGCLQGRHFTTPAGNRYEAYLGVPYAAPPVGELRFKNPRPIQPWSELYDATFERSMCVQKNDLFLGEKVEGSEDCLYLNVYKPKKNINSPMAVMVFIHGGGFFAGSATMGQFGPERFMDTGEVILVVMQYRLGVFGFLSTGDHAATGNFGLKDQNAALRWVQRNIEKFEGDPTLVTLFGHSAGGAAVQMHMMSSLSKGLFARAIMMSGSALGFWNQPISDPLDFARKQAAAVGIGSSDTLSSDELVAALRKIDASQLCSSVDKLKFWYVYPIAPYHVAVEKYIDNDTFISEDPRKIWARGGYHQVPWRIGFVPNEGSFGSVAIVINSTLVASLNEHSNSYIPRIVGCKENDKSRNMLRNRFFPGGTEHHWITDANVNQIQTLFTEAFVLYPLALSVSQHNALEADRKSPLDVYRFSFKSNHSNVKYFAKTDLDFGVGHADDLPYLFRSPDLFDDYEHDSPDGVMAEKLVDYYKRFAYNGVSDESCQESCKILEFTNSNNASEPVKLNVISGFDNEMVAFWSDIYSECAEISECFNLKQDVI
ncbi:juvenile hormone esterase-like [Topomyia yanbarensis]|uniref:juvenile hormone esterase-like n=1 Tax=Topomyia yanbarensis TaxID=2498891 RepID=UPI00273B46AF|nr:juvenile hormone esterase-like [Topomyia yanbarensis]